jgi:hypothetical protein
MKAHIIFFYKKVECISEYIFAFFNIVEACVHHLDVLCDMIT